ncbi:MAG: DNA polymerase I [Candidatus Binatia bacterium]
MRDETASSVYLLDISYFIFRSYHALPQLNTSGGIPTNAVHGVTNILEKLIRIEKPSYMAAAFDSARRTFRNDIYAAYKANRAEPEEDLRLQFPFIERLVDAMAIRAVRKSGYEADDLLASMASRFAGEQRPVVIVTGDKDLMQCVGPHVSLFDPFRGSRVSDSEVIDKFGVPPSGVTDVLALMGDSSDNIPGVRGIGPKTATALIAHFGSIEDMYERLDEIEQLEIRGAASVKKKVAEGADLARISKRLATVIRDVELGLSIEDLAFSSPYTPQLMRLAEELEMKGLAVRLKALGSDGGSRAEVAGTMTESAEPDAVSDGGKSDGQSLRIVEHEKPKAVAGDISGDWMGLCGANLVFARGEDAFGELWLCLAEAGEPVLIRGREAIGGVVARLVEGGTSFRGFDLKGLCRDHGLERTPAGVDLGLASYLYDPSVGEHDVATVCRRFLGEERLEPDAGSKTALRASMEQLASLADRVEEALAERGQRELHENVEHPLLAILAGIERRGMLLEVGLLKAMSADFDHRMRELVSKVFDAAGAEFNILSPVQLREILFERLELPTRGIRKTKTGFSTDSDSLQALAAHHPLPRLVLEYRALAKLKSTYVDALPRLADADSRVHTRLNQMVTATGRLSSSDPNLQNIPTRTKDGALIRRAFTVPEGYVMVSADYNQIELRVLADLSSDEALIQAFQESEDIHLATACELFDVKPESVAAEMRRQAKIINFGIIYGMGPVRMSRELGISRDEAALYIERYFARYPGVQRFFDEMLDAARRDGYVSTLFGRRRYLPEIHSEHGGKRQMAERVATNTPIQGSAADIIKIAMVSTDRRLRESGLSASMLLQVHDELLLECPKDELEQVLSVVCSSMETAVKLAVPVVVDLGWGANWAEAH